MTTTVPALAPTILPYHRQGEIDYARLDCNPDEPVLKPEAVEQEQPMQELLGLLASRFPDFGQRPDTFLSSNTILCYDPDDLNVRVSPDVYLAFGVAAQAIRPRKLYLPWEVGKPPDWVLEIGSASTGREDVGRKRDLCARIGVPEYWRFDPKDGAYHGEQLAGDRLVGGAYRPIALTTAPDGILKGYSPVLGLSLCWDNNWPRLYDPATNSYLTNWRQERAARQAERAAYEAQAAVEQAERLAERAARQAAENRAASEQSAREAAEARIRQLEAELRRRQADR
ncbi:MAG: Uma2 family endonuclease [Chloroflexota bacterium]|nr:Uma2 family endonuclease [Chloroflexota bacterium]